MSDSEDITFEDALQLRNNNFLFLSWQTTDPHENQEKIKEIDNLLDQYTRKNQKLVNRIEKMENKIEKLDDELKRLDDQHIFQKDEKEQ